MGYFVGSAKGRDVTSLFGWRGDKSVGVEKHSRKNIGAGTEGGHKRHFIREGVSRAESKNH